MGTRAKVRFVGAVVLLLLGLCLCAFSLNRAGANDRKVRQLIALAGGVSDDRDTWPFRVERQSKLPIRDEDTRRALEGLRSLGDYAEGALIRQLQAKESPWRRHYEGIRLRSPAWAQDLLQPWPSATSQRQAAVLAIGRLGVFSARTERALLGVCNNPDSIVREGSLLILAYRGSRSVEMVQAVDDFLRRCPQLASRLNTQGPRAFGFDLRPKTVEETIQDLNRPLAESRYQAASRLRELGSNAAPALSALLGNCEDPSDLVRVASAKALGSIGPAATNALPSLRKMRTDDISFVRKAAVDAIQSIARPPE